MKTFPEINALNLEQCRQALGLAYANTSAVTKAAQRDILQRIRHLEDRIRRLELSQRQHNARGRRFCRQCGAPEKRYAFGYSNLTPFSQICPACLSRILKEAEPC